MLIMNGQVYRTRVPLWCNAISSSAKTCAFVSHAQVLEVFGRQIAPPHHGFLRPGMGGNEDVLNALSARNDCLPLASECVNT